MSLAGTVKNAAERAIKTYGAVGTLTRTVDGNFDPENGMLAQTTTTAAVRALLDASSPQGLGFKFGAELVQGGDLKATLATKGVTPEVGDRLTLVSGSYAVIAVRPSYVGATPVMFECLVRR